MTKALFVLCALTVAMSVQAQAKTKAPVAKLDSQLMSGHLEGLKQNINLSSDSSGVWTLEVVKDCESYPCSPADFTTRTKIKVVKMMDARAGDGPLTIQFSNGMILKERASGFGMLPASERKKVPPFTLDLKIDGAAMTIPLILSTYIKTNTYE